MPANAPRVYLDANVLIAYLSDEKGRADIVQHVLDDARKQRIELLTSVFSIAEVAYIASESGSGIADDDESSIDQLWAPASPITLIDVSATVTRSARSIIRKSVTAGGGVVKPPDAIHLASADLHGCERMFTYEKPSSRKLWTGLIGPDVEEPFTDVPRLDI